MSDIAVTWAKAQACPDRNAKQVLVHLASYADAQGEAWAMVPLLALEMEVVDRTVQRGLRTLEGVGLLKRTGRTKTHRGRVMPIYQLPLDLGHANTKRRMSADASARGDTGVTPRRRERERGKVQDGSAPAGAGAEETEADRAPETAAAAHETHDRGDADVTPDGPIGVTRVSPQGVADVTPRGDTGVTQIGKEDSQGVNPSACACARAQRLWGAKAPERLSPRRVSASWDAAMTRTGVEAEALLSAVAAAVKADPDFKRGKAMNLDRWLDEDRFLAWLNASEGKPPTARATWCGPDDVMRAVASVMGSAPRASYLDPAGWDEERRVVLGRTRFAVDRLRAEAGLALKAIGVSVEYAGG